MKIWVWLKSLSWVAIVGAIAAATMMVIRAFQASKMEAIVTSQEERIQDLSQGTIDDIKEAAALQKANIVRKRKAREIRKKSEANLERIGQDETMADIAERFNNKRVRSREDTATGL